MDLEGALLGGLLATVVLTTMLTAAQGLGWSRMSMPFILGTMLSADRHRAMLTGFLVYFAGGWAFALLYAWIFEFLQRVSWLVGGALGLGQALFLLIALMPVLPSLHPRMASQHHGPEPTRALEPPGFMALHYGRQTPLVTVAAHIVYGAIIGGLYRL